MESTELDIPNRKSTYNTLEKYLECLIINARKKSHQSHMHYIGILITLIKITQRS